MYQIVYEIDEILDWVKKETGTIEHYTGKLEWLRCFDSILNDVLDQISKTNFELSQSANLDAMLHEGKVQFVCTEPNCDDCAIERSNKAVVTSAVGDKYVVPAKYMHLVERAMQKPVKKKIGRPKKNKT